MKIQFAIVLCLAAVTSAADKKESEGKVFLTPEQAGMAYALQGEYEGSAGGNKLGAQVIANADQGGLGLPDRDYYLKDDAKSVELRKGYVAHVQKMFELLGDKPETAAANAQTVMRIETALAKGSMTRVERRDPKALDHKMTTTELEKITPEFRWPVYFDKVGLPPSFSLNVSAPGFLKGPTSSRFLASTLMIGRPRR